MSTLRRFLATHRRGTLAGALLVLVLAGSAAVLAGACRGRGDQLAAKYYCPMHPTYVSDEPGDCPICNMRLVPFVPGKPATATLGAPAGAPAERQVLYYRHPMDPKVTSPVPMKDSMGMDFVPVYADETGVGGVPGLAAVSLDERGIRLAGVRVAVAARGTLARSTRTVGMVTLDERRIRHVHTKIMGWVEKLYVNFTGQLVRAGEPILSLYSPELLASQQELLRAREAAARFAGSSLPEVRKGGEELATAARQRLELFDVPASFIAELDEERPAAAHRHAQRAGQRLRHRQGGVRGAGGAARHGAVHARRPLAGMGGGGLL